MIVTDPTPQSPLKAGQATLDAQLDNGSRPQGPPAYVSYGTYHRPAPRRGQSPARRFFGAFCVTFVIYTLVATLTSSVVWVGVSRHGRSYTQTWPGDDSQGWPAPTDGDISQCIGGADWTTSPTSPETHYPYTAHTEFELPLTSDVLYLLARGRLAHGSVKVSHWENGEDIVKVDIQASYYSQSALDRANVCSLSGRRGGHGIGIFTPESWTWPSKEHYIQFDVLLRIPAHQASPALIHAFETDLPNFSHSFYTAQRVKFESLSVHGSNSPIFAQSLQAEHATLKTSNSGISGSFNTTTSLELRTSNGRITAAVGLTNDPSGSPTSLILKTSNAQIDSVLSLISSEHVKGSFDVNSETSNGRLVVHYDATPIDSTLVHHARTSNSPATVRLNPAYEGEFSVQSSNISPSVVSGKDVEDPAGHGRKRWLSVNKVKNVLSGAVYWGTGGRERAGKVDLTTSNSPAQLVLS